MRLTINLATREYVDMRRLNLSIAVSLFILVVILLINARNIASDLGDMERLQRGISVFEGKSKVSKKAEVPEKDYQALVDKIKFANGIIEKKSFDWLVLLDRLESVVPDGVGIASIEPSDKNDNMKLTGVARNFGALRKLVENLEDSGFFTGIYLVSQSEFRGPEGDKGTGFDISCKAKLK